MKEYVVPAAGRLVVEPAEAPKQAGSILLSEKHSRKPTWGKVLAIGPEAAEKLVGIRADNTFCVGKTVAYEFAAGNTLCLKDGSPQGHEVVVLKWDEVLGLIEER